ncbi:Bifunctional protein including Segregation and condensation protein A and dihydrofolate reductase [Mycoplasmoides gallisepticum str. R(low)]|uniref:Segregation and condensation protein A n=2 Tax=Mycoplasmoides gallisepticum TaxID=2096 RepID=SCPA_MYCGA|nr:segregation/condensation protein A [Mycoplasmoides gallisepticum]Q7NB76.2 RecName: Full=Segregation and condensation protein A [Mycoplasmoides gallisepticum str. R(low)]AAP56753.2 Bifunctional protein including Segregation and condensation protein A and dihydrofolate reductase [Mycoplasmoides gallisepticum str. R(low)]ADC30606.1 Bifunctional protein including Segregation and condensation protein A and dihydrofolate reductase [Mycoplasmoides gallisepticum str. R(high)]
MIKLIWCEDLNHGIAKNNQIPWKIDEELNHFHQTTTNHPIIMGYNTYLAMNKILANQANIVISKKHQRELKNKNELFLYSDLKKALIDFSIVDLFIIGGKKTIEQAIKYADQLVISKLNADYGCDLFVNLNYDDFSLVQTKEYDQFVVEYWERKPNTKKPEDLIEELNINLNDDFLNLSFKHFSGPFDLLLHLIKDKKMDIMALDLFELTNQYFAYINKHMINLDLVSDYLYMACELLRIKSDLSIPNFEDETKIDLNNDDERDRIVKRIIEYKRYSELLPSLQKMQLERFSLFAKEEDDWDVFKLTSNDLLEAPLPDYVNPKKLKKAMERVFEKLKIKTITEHKIVIEELSIEDVKNEILSIIKKLLNNQYDRFIDLEKIFEQIDPKKLNLRYFVTSFVCLLILVREQKIDLNQKNDDESISACLVDPTKIVNSQESIQEVIQRQQEDEKALKESIKQIQEERKQSFFKQREEYLKKKYGEYYVSREQYQKLTPEEKINIRINQRKIDEQEKLNKAKAQNLVDENNQIIDLKTKKPSAKQILYEADLIIKQLDDLINDQQEDYDSQAELEALHTDLIKLDDEQEQDLIKEE